VTPALAERLARARAHAARGEVLQAEALFTAVLRDDPQCAEAACGIAYLALQRDDWDRAAQHFALAHAAAPDAAHVLPHVEALWQAGRTDEAIARLSEHLHAQPDDALAWLQWAECQEASGDALAAARGRFQGMTRAQKKGRWLDQASTEPQYVELVRSSVQRLNTLRREHLMASFDAARREHGADAVKRVEHALRSHLGEFDATPPDARQRPKFLYFPGLPDLPYHDPYLQPWASTLREAWTEIRDEAASLLAEDAPLEDFLGLKPGERNEAYLSGDGPAPAWDAFFFYRHGKRYDANHARCPRTSALLESIELCRIADQAPEICFSVLRPGSTIMPHHGVTNTRLVFHLPLIVPSDCALNILDAGAHHWVAGEPMMFDDTFRHEAWNRSGQTRVILLMDCWNPHLTPPEKAAVKQLVEAIDRFERSPL
jgi:aspartate beta-hydroxylase